MMRAGKLGFSAQCPRPAGLCRNTHSTRRLSRSVRSARLRRYTAQQRDGRTGRSRLSGSCFNGLQILRGLGWRQVRRYHPACPADLRGLDARSPEIPVFRGVQRALLGSVLSINRIRPGGAYHTDFCTRYIARVWSG